jgi:RHS repeat-associated protein
VRGVGETLSSVGSFDTDFGYTGELTDGTGLINLRARYYDPSTGRFLTKDSWAGDSSTPATLVKWLYANSNPVMYTDPNGRWALNNMFTLSNGGFYQFGLLEAPPTYLLCDFFEHCQYSRTFKANIFIHGLGGNDIRYAQYQVIGADPNSDISVLNLSDLQLKFFRYRDITDSDCQTGDYVEFAEYFSSNNWRFVAEYSDDSYNFETQNDSVSGYTIASGDPITVPDDMQITGNNSALGPQTYGQAMSTPAGSVVQLVYLAEQSRFATMSMRHREFRINIAQNKVNEQIFQASIITTKDNGNEYQLGYMNGSWFEVIIGAGIFLR